MRRPYDTLGARPASGSPGAVVIPGATQINRAPRSRGARDSTRTATDTLRTRDSTRSPRDTTNPFKIPPA